MDGTFGVAFLSPDSGRDLVFRVIAVHEVTLLTKSPIAPFFEYTCPYSLLFIPSRKEEDIPNV